MNIMPRISYYNGVEVMPPMMLSELLEPARHGLSYGQLAMKINGWLHNKGGVDGYLGVDSVTPEAVRRICLGLVRMPHKAYLEAMSEILEVNQAELFAAAGYFSPSDALAATPLEAIERALRGRKDVSEVQRQQVLAFATELFRPPPRRRRNASPIS